MLTVVSPVTEIEKVTDEDFGFGKITCNEIKPGEFKRFETVVKEIVAFFNSLIKDITFEKLQTMARTRLSE